MRKIIFNLVAICSISLMFGQTTTENYVKNTIYRTETTTGNVTNDKKNEIVTYLDELGRPMQNVGLRSGGTGEDIVSYIGYDTLGRQDKEYLPYTSTETSGSYRANALTGTKTFYDASKYDDDFPGMSTSTINPYSQKAFESSPLNRVLKQAAPGKDWKLGAGNEIEFEYGINTNSEVRYYEVSLTKNVDNNVITYTPTLVLDTSTGNNNGYYLANSLYKSVIKDENHDGSSTKNHTTEEFKDKKGRVVLKRIYADLDINDDGDTNDTGETEVSHDTYYVYDKYGNLSYVLPPKVEAHIDIPSNSGQHSELTELCYRYSYDEKNRLVSKAIPGGSVELIVYNNLDQPIMTQNYYSLTSSEGSGWNFMKYDAFGRVAYTGRYSTYSMSLDHWYTTYQNNANTASSNYEAKLSANPSSLGGTTVYYTDNAYPNNLGNNCKVLTINYYDDYNFDIGSGTPETSGGITPITNPKGLPTGSKVRVLGTNQWITTVTYYDNESRPIYIYSYNEYLGTTDKVKNEYDFAGNILKSITTHARSGHNTITTIDIFSYDHMGRLISHRQTINNQPQETIISNTYNELGQLVGKNVGGEQTSNQFIDEVNLTIAGNIITKTHNSSSWNTGLATAKSITNDGYIEYSIPQTDKAIMVGLSSDNSSTSYTTIDYAMYTRHDGHVYVYESGANKAGAIETYQVGDIFRVERIGSVIYYKKNGTTIYTSTVSSSGALIGDISIHHYQGSIFDLNIHEPSKTLQNVDYNYNIRGWLKQINNPNSLGNDLFAFNIGYNEGANPLYNGNISSTQWKTANTDNNLKTYNYQYDALNRITSAIDDLNRYSLSNVFYDRNGNIKRLKRKGHVVAQPVSTNNSHFGVMDDLRYTYQSNSNKLLKVEDVAPIDAFGYKDDAVNQAPDTLNDYSYNGGGALELDETKTLLFWKYNHLGQPVEVMNYSNGGIIQYIYTAAGTKLKKVVSTGETTEYADDYIYEDTGSGSSLKFFNQPEGYVDASGSGYEYVYQYKDHLGNVRLSYSDINNNGAIEASSEILEENNYYPFGLKHKGYNDGGTAFYNPALDYQYNGIEYEESLGLNLYEMDVRSYDPAIGRFTSIDPVAHHSMSTYMAFDGNPIYWADPSGADAIDDWAAEKQSEWDAYDAGVSARDIWGSGNMSVQKQTQADEYYMDELGFWVNGDSNLGEYIGNVAPSGGQGGYLELVQINGEYYHKNTNNLFAELANALGGSHVEHKLYDPASERAWGEFQANVVGFGIFKAGGIVFKILKKAGGSLWKLPMAGPGSRGFVYEKLLNLKGTFKVNNYPVIDAFNKGVATSIKTIDLALSSYTKSNNAVFNTLKGYVKKLSNFKGANWSGINTTNGVIKNKVLELGIPRGATQAQINQINNAVKYAKGLGIKMNVRVVR